MIPVIFFLSFPFATDPPSQSAKQAENDRYKALRQTAKRLIESKYYEQAIATLQTAYSINPEPQIWYEMSQIYETHLQDYPSAIDMLEKYREVAPPSEYIAIDRQITNLRERNEALENPSETEDISETIEQDLPPQPSRWAQYTAFGFAAAAFATSIYFGTQKNAVQRDISNVCSNTICTSSAISLIAQEREHAMVADIGWGVTALSIGFGMYLSRQSSYPISTGLPLVLEGK